MLSQITGGKLQTIKKKFAGGMMSLDEARRELGMGPDVMSDSDLRTMLMEDELSRNQMDNSKWEQQANQAKADADRARRQVDEEKLKYEQQMRANKAELEQERNKRRTYEYVINPGKLTTVYDIYGSPYSDTYSTVKYLEKEKLKKEVRDELFREVSEARARAPRARSRSKPRAKAKPKPRAKSKSKKKA